MIASGGMPSSHSSTVTALAVAIRFQEGFADSVFAITMILACVVMYDAVGVRLHAGKQAEVLNQIVYELPSEHQLAEARPSRELLGHTPCQVLAGSVLGIVIAVIGIVFETCIGSSIGHGKRKANDASENILKQKPTHRKIQTEKIGKCKYAFWKSLFSPEGRIRDGGAKLLKKVRCGGIDPSIRVEVWPFLLAVYDLSSSEAERNIM